MGDAEFDAIALQERLAKAQALLLEWEDKYAPPGDVSLTIAEMYLDDIGEALGLWGREQ